MADEVTTINQILVPTKHVPAESISLDHVVETVQSPPNQKHHKTHQHPEAHHPAKRSRISDVTDEYMDRYHSKKLAGIASFEVCDSTMMSTFINQPPPLPKFTQYRQVFSEIFNSTRLVLETYIMEAYMQYSNEDDDVSFFENFVDHTFLRLDESLSLIEKMVSAKLCFKAELLIESKKYIAAFCAAVRTEYKLCNNVDEMFGGQWRVYYDGDVARLTITDRHNDRLYGRVVPGDFGSDFIGIVASGGYHIPRSYSEQTTLYSQNIPSIYRTIEGCLVSAHAEKLENKKTFTENRYDLTAWSECFFTILSRAYVSLSKRWVDFEHNFTQYSDAAVVETTQFRQIRRVACGDELRVGAFESFFYEIWQAYLKNDDTADVIAGAEKEKSDDIEKIRFSAFS